tara:strand:- start:239 stop:736 length:498 start_codon:yes stop_codon:yes gene_type:complete
MIKLTDLLSEEKLTESSDTFVNILTKFGFKKGARDWGGHQFFVHKSKDLYATYHPNGRSLVIEPKRGGKPVFDSARSNFSIKALLNYLQSPSNKFISTEGKFVPTVTIEFTRENRGKGKTEVKKFKTIDDAKKYTKQMNKKYKLKRQKGFWGNPVTGIELTWNFS